MILNFIIVYIWSQSTWTGGKDQFYFYDTTKFLNINNLDNFKPGRSLSLKYSGFIPLFELDTSSLSRVSKITEIEGVLYFLKSYPYAKIFYSNNLTDLNEFPSYPNFQEFPPETVNDILKKGNIFLSCGKRYGQDLGYIYKFDINSNSFVWPPITFSGIHNIVKLYKNFPGIYISAASGRQYQWIKSNDLFSSYSTHQIANNILLEKSCIVPHYSISDTFLLGIFYYNGLRNIYYSDYNPPQGSWFNVYPSYRSFEAGEIVFDSIKNCVYIPVVKAESSVIRVFNIETKTIDTTIYLDNSQIFNGLTLGKDKNIYAVTFSKVYRSIDRKNFEVIGLLPGAYYVYQTSDYELLVGTYGPAKIFKTDYFSSGYLESSVFISRNKKEGATFFKRVFIEGENLNYVRVQIRGDTLDSLQNAPPWGSLPYLNNGDTITHLNPYSRYFQYRIFINKTSSNKSPRVDRIYFTYDLDTTGPLITNCFISDGNISQSGIDIDDRLIIVFNEKTNKPYISLAGIDTLFYISGGRTLLGSDSVRWKSDDTLYIYLYHALSPPQPGDTIKILKKFIKDIWKNSSLSYSLIGGTYDDLNPPKLKKVILTDGNIPDNGAGTGDTVIMIFSEKTNTPPIPPESLDSWFPIKNSWLNSGYSVQTLWKSQDTFLILFNGFGKEPLLRDDSVYVSNNNKIKDLGGNKIIPQKIKTTGSLDNKNPVISSAIFYDYKPFSPNPNSNFDHTIIKFSEPVILTRIINRTNIDSVFKLSFNHSWLSGNGNAERLELLNDTIFIIQFSTDGGNPTVREGDTILVDSLFFVDRNKNKIKGKIILERFLEIEEILKRDFSFSFNINKNIISINSDFPFYLNIFDLSGRKIFEGSYESGMKNFYLNLKKGIYFLSIRKKDKEILKKKIFIIKN
ncbi:MAG: T9SS type A sorting domain-containing protein [candidate division WOR-3 bacterium]